MNSNINIHGMQQQMPGVSPVMIQQASPQQPGQLQQQVPNPNQQQPQQQQQQQQQQHQQQQVQQQQQQKQQAEQLDNISKIKTLLGPLRESLFLTFRFSAFTLQHNNLADNLKRDGSVLPHRYEKHLEDFYAYCDQIELNLRTTIQCMQQLSSAQHFLPGTVTVSRSEPYLQDGNTMPIPYSTFLNTARVHVQTVKDIHDTLISAAQNISQAD